MDAGEKYWSVINPYWDAIEIDSAESFDRTFKTVPRNVGLLYAAHFCQSEVCNGGFTQFFWNSTGVLAPEAVEGFATIGQPKLGGVIEKAMLMLGLPYVRDRTVRWAAMERLHGDWQRTSLERPRMKRVTSFEPLEQEFYALLRSEAGGFEEAADRYAESISATNVPPE